MGATEDTANDGGDKKIVVKDERKGGKGGGQGYFIPRHSGRDNSDKSPKKENFQGAYTELTGHVFEAGANCSAQIATTPHQWKLRYDRLNRYMLPGTSPSSGTCHYYPLWSGVG